MDISISLLLTLVVAVVVIAVLGMIFSDKVSFLQTFGKNNSMINVTVFGG